jgi:hypothetical protein
VGNDCSDNNSAGLKCFLYAPPQKPINPPELGHGGSRLTVMASGNTFRRNGTYGLVVEGNNVFRSINYPLTGSSGQFQNNSFADNTPAQSCSRSSHSVYRSGIPTHEVYQIPPERDL